jgi:hypothetical protein
MRLFRKDTLKEQAMKSQGKKCFIFLFLAYIGVIVPANVFAIEWREIAESVVLLAIVSRLAPNKPVGFSLEGMDKTNVNNS